jgi:hypothetical protein
MISKIGKLQREVIYGVMVVEGDGMRSEYLDWCLVPRFGSRGLGHIGLDGGKPNHACSNGNADVLPAVCFLKLEAKHKLE